MAAKPSTAAEEALQKTQEQVTCGIYLKSYKQPKLLRCFHVYCEQCLQHLVHEGDGLPCPQCQSCRVFDEIIDLDTLTGDVITFVPPLKKTLFCCKHLEKEANLHCEICVGGGGGLIC